jgi:hypothetical protein
MDMREMTMAACPTCRPRTITDNPATASREEISFKMDLKPMGTQVSTKWTCQQALPDEW